MRVLVPILFLLTLSGCGYLPFTQNNPTHKESLLASRDIHRKRFEVVNGKSLLVGEDIERVRDSNQKAIVPPKTLWQKMWGLVGGWALLMILGIFFPPVAAVMGFINHRLGKTVTHIVQGVEDYKEKADQTEKQKLLDSLSMTMDSDVKKVVAKERMKLT